MEAQRKNKIENFLSQIKKMLYKDKVAQEIEKTRLEIEAHPQDLRLKIKLAELYFKKREVAQAIVLFREVADVYLQEDFLLKAVAVYKNIIRMAPGTVEFNEKLADLYCRLGMLKDAMNQYLIVIHYYQNHQETEKMIEAAEKMVAVDPTEISGRLRLAEIYYNHGKQDKALAEYEKISQELKEKEGGVQVGLLLDVLEKVYLRRPKDLNLLKEICILYLKQHNPDVVLKKIEKLKLEQEGAFHQIYLKAQEMSAYLEQKKAASQEKPHEV